MKKLPSVKGICIASGNDATVALAEKIAGTEKADRLHDRNTCAFSDNDRLSKYGDTAYPTWYP